MDCWRSFEILRGCERRLPLGKYDGVSFRLRAIVSNRNAQSDEASSWMPFHASRNQAGHRRFPRLRTFSWLQPRIAMPSKTCAVCGCCGGLSGIQKPLDRLCSCFIIPPLRPFGGTIHFTVACWFTSGRGLLLVTQAPDCIQSGNSPYNGERDGQTHRREDYRSGRVPSAAHRHQLRSRKDGGHERRMDSHAHGHTPAALCRTRRCLIPSGHGGREKTAGHERLAPRGNRNDRRRHRHPRHALSGHGLPDSGPSRRSRRPGDSISPRHARASSTR